MTRDQMLKQMGLNKSPHGDEHLDLVAKFSHFYHGLSPAQQKVVTTTMPQLAQAAKTFSGNVTPDDLKKAAGHEAEAAGFWGFAISTPPPPPPPHK